MDDFLDRMAAAATVVPCVVPRADLLMLLTLAGYANRKLYRLVRSETSDSVSVNAVALLDMVREAQERTSSQDRRGSP